MNFTLGLSDTTWGFIMIVTCLLWFHHVSSAGYNELHVVNQRKGDHLS